MTEHLIELGHRDISFFSVSNIVSLPSVTERLGGFLNTMQNHGLSIKPEYIISKMTDSSPEAICEQLRTLLDAGVTAVICENDGVARSLLHACKTLSLKVPDDISICGFSDDYENITSINQNEELIADHIGNIFLESLTPARTISHKILVPADLHKKTSTGPRPADYPKKGCLPTAPCTASKSYLILHQKAILPLFHCLPVCSPYRLHWQSA